MKKIIAFLGSALLVFTQLVGFPAADDISRLYSFSSGTTIQSSQVNQEFNQLISTMNNKGGRGVANTWTAANTFSGNNTFSGTNTFTHASTPILTDKISEYGTGSGVTVDSVLLKDGFIRVPAGAGYTPATNGDFGYDSTAHSYDVYVNGAAKSVLHTGSSIDDLGDVTITSPANAQAIYYNGSAWINGVAPGSWELVQTQTASAASAVDFTTGFASGYDYKWVITELDASTDAVGFQMRVGIDGSTFRSTAGDYMWGSMVGGSVGTTGAGSLSDTEIDLALAGDTNFDLGDAAGEPPHQFIVESHNADIDGAVKHTFFYRGAIYASSGRVHVMSGQGAYKGTTDDILNVRFQITSGTFNGTLRMYRKKRN